MGINNNKIGIIGSILVNINDNPSDFDIIIYGKDNFKRYQQNISKTILRWYSQANYQHIEALTLSSLRNHPIGFEKMISAKINRTKTLFFDSTTGDIFSIHFSYETNISPDINIGAPIKQIHIYGIMGDELSSYFRPYRYKIKDSNIQYQVIAHSFAYYATANKGDNMEVFGTLRTNNIITIDKPNHYVVPIYTQLGD